MIIFDLRCEPQGHVFEAWFGSTADFESQLARGLVACPICGAPEVAKAPMAPAVGAKSNAAAAATAPELFSGDAARVKAMLAAAAAVQKRMLEGSESVGDRFADEARAIHLGESERRAIHGRATRAEAESLVEDGVPVAPLPFPALDPGEEN
ncbi:MAG: hypothetical protein QOH04_3170 [Sphingomonadales bacterium]|jgi:hypothetical protein|nr:hypothetical protein [Sphingomonadales bacterium]MEA3037368.1 hypothetical protein [Sphingomonadales bacterium]